VRGGQIWSSRQDQISWVSVTAAGHHRSAQGLLEWTESLLAPLTSVLCQRKLC
jgi:hypothetical protein